MPKRVKLLIENKGSIEIAKQQPVQKIILISSIKTRHELPGWMKIVAKTRVNKIYPMRGNKITEQLQNYFLGATSKGRILWKINWYC